MTREIRITTPDYRAFCDICQEEGSVFVFSLGVNGRMDVAVCQDCARYIVDFYSDENRAKRAELGLDE